MRKKNSIPMRVNIDLKKELKKIAIDLDKKAQDLTLEDIEKGIKLKKEKKPERFGIDLRF